MPRNVVAIILRWVWNSIVNVFEVPACFLKHKLLSQEGGFEPPMSVKMAAGSRRISGSYYMVSICEHVFRVAVEGRVSA